MLRRHNRLLVALHEGRVPAHRIPDVTIEGTAMPALTVDLSRSGPLTLVLDPATGLIARQRYPARGRSGIIEEVFTDYRDVDGLKVAFAVTIRHPAEPPITRTLRTFEYNVPLDASVFAKQI